MDAFSMKTRSDGAISVSAPMTVSAIVRSPKNTNIFHGSN